MPFSNKGKIYKDRQNDRRRISYWMERHMPSLYKIMKGKKKES